VQRAPGIPHALFGRIDYAQLGRNALREGGGVFEIGCLMNFEFISVIPGRAKREPGIHNHDRG
jgi:hypothetical protein